MAERLLAPEDWLVVPGERVGAITAASTEADLRRAYGEEALILDPDLATGAALLPANDPASMLDLTWARKKTRTGVRAVRAGYGAFRWATADGIRHGLSLPQLAARRPGDLVVEALGVVHFAPALTLTLRIGPVTLPQRVLRRYFEGPAWASDDPEMREVAADLRLTEMHVELD